MNVQTRTVTEAEADTRLDRWFRRHFPNLTQGALQKMLRTGQVRVDGKRAEANTRLAVGQEVRIPPLPPAASRPAPLGMKPVSERDAKELERMVLHRDEQVIVIDKPHGLAVQGGPGITRNLDAMLDALRFGAPDRPRLVHRLDRDTSGLIVVARSAKAAREHGSLPPPLHVRNAPTKLLRQLGYGRGYAYDHDAPDRFSGADYFPEGMARATFYAPAGDGFEAELKARGERLAELRRARGGAP